MAVGARVDKLWREKGLEAYDTEAILATLAHYGIDASEAAYRAATEACYPLALAHDWGERWKGTGPFAAFPTAAALELWSRWRPGEATPSDVGLAMAKLVEHLEGRLEGAADDGTQDTRFKVVEAYLVALPTEATRRAAFLEELHAILQGRVPGLGALLVRLAHRGLPDEAKRFASLEELLDADAAGTRHLLLSAFTGDRAAAVAALEGHAKDEARTWPQRLTAVGAFFELEEFARAAPIVVAAAKAAVAAREPQAALWSAGLIDVLLASSLPDALWDELHGARLELEDAFPALVPAHDHHAHG